MKIKALAVLLITVMLFSLAGCSGSNGGKEYSVTEYRTTMQYHDDFKILQLADVHLGIQTDVAHQLGIIKNAIRTEKPDLIILTGDNFMYASSAVVDLLIKTLNDECESLTAERERLTKFTMTFGNHDNQGDYSRYYINSVMKKYVTTDGQEIANKKFAAFVDYEDDNLFGLTNFYIDLVDDINKDISTVDVKYRLHVIDSNTYHFMGPDYDYDVIHPEQLEHAKAIYNGATADKEYIGMAFFHIPFYEYQYAYDEYIASENKESLGQGEYLEGVLYPYENNGSYEKLCEANIISFVCGHNHKNFGDYLYKGTILSYGVKSTNQLYHDVDVIGYKTVTLKDITPEQFVSIENVNENFKNFTGGYLNYENK